MKGIKSKNGITLIALIITIIILIVLAVVAIAAVRNSGIFIYVNRSVIMHEVGTLSEIIRLESQEIKLDSAQPNATEEEQTVYNSLKRLYGSEPTLITVKGARGIPSNISDGKYYLVTPEQLGVNTKRGKGTDADIFVANDAFEVFYIIEMDGQPLSLDYKVEPSTDYRGNDTGIIKVAAFAKGYTSYSQFVEPYLTAYSNMSDEEKEQFKQQSVMKGMIYQAKRENEEIPPNIENAENIQDFLYCILVMQDSNTDKTTLPTTFKGFLAYMYQVEESQITEEIEMQFLVESEMIEPEGYYGPTYVDYASEILKNATDAEKEKIFMDGIIYMNESEGNTVPDEAKVEGISFQDFVFVMTKAEDPTTPDEAKESMPKSLKEFIAMQESIDATAVTDEMVDQFLIAMSCIKPQEYLKEIEKYPGSKDGTVTIKCMDENNTEIGYTRSVKLGENVEFTVTKNGNYIVTAESNGETVTETVPVNVIPELSLDKTELTIDMFKNEEGNLSAIISNIEGKTVTWTNSNSDIVEIVSDGNNLKLTGKRAGTATITATYNKLKATCEVTVSDLIGKFVEYDVEYTDVFNNNNYYTKTNGWRVFDYTKNADGSLSDVKLISTGIPGKVDYSMSWDYAGDSWPVKDDAEINKYLKEVEGRENPQFSSEDAEWYDLYPLRTAAGLYYNFGKVKFICAETYNDNIKFEGIYKCIRTKGVTYDDKTTADVSGNTLFNLRNDTNIRILTIKEILNKGYYIKNDGSFSYLYLTKGYMQDGLINIHRIKNLPNMSNYTYDRSGWLLANRSGYHDYLSGILDGYEYGEWIYKYNGVRPLICFNSSIKLEDSNNDGVYEIVDN